MIPCKVLNCDDVDNLLKSDLILSDIFDDLKLVLIDSTTDRWEIQPILNNIIMKERPLSFGGGDNRILVFTKLADGEKVISKIKSLKYESR